MYPEIEVRQLRCVIAVADELHFTRAAQKLHITQSALTRQIRHLELQLGVDLFIRGTRHVEPTDAGRALVEDGRKALELLDRGVRRALGAGRGDLPFGRCHIGAALQNLGGHAKRTGRRIGTQRRGGQRKS